MPEKDCSDCCRRLDLIGKLLIGRLVSERPLSERELLLDLTEMGFTPAEIAPLLGKSANAVRVAQTRLRNKGILKGDSK